MHYNCLIVDDEKELAQMTSEYFNLFDVSCVWTDTAQGCEQMMTEHDFDLLLLDINLNEESGFRLCKKIRDTSDLPILFISARQSDEDILTALNIGGDDYIKKPYTLSVLLAKIKAVLKRVRMQEQACSVGGAGRSTNRKSNGAGTANSRSAFSATGMSVEVDVHGEEAVERTGHTVKQAGHVWLDEATMKVGTGEREVQLKAKEFKLFACLFEHRGTIVTKNDLFDMVWGDTFYSDGTLNVHIRRLREKLEENPNEPKLIRTVWGTGYMLEL